MRLVRLMQVDCCVFRRQPREDFCLPRPGLRGDSSEIVEQETSVINRPAVVTELLDDVPQETILQQITYFSVVRHDDVDFVKDSVFRENFVKMCGRSDDRLLVCTECYTG